jgi:hypothetical protein
MYCVVSDELTDYDGKFVLVIFEQTPHLNRNAQLAVGFEGEVPIAMGVWSFSLLFFHEFSH